MPFGLVGVRGDELGRELLQELVSINYNYWRTGSTLEWMAIMYHARFTIGEEPGLNLPPATTCDHNSEEVRPLIGSYYSFRSNL